MLHNSNYCILLLINAFYSVGEETYCLSELCNTGLHPVVCAVLELDTAGSETCFEMALYVNFSLLHLVLAGVRIFWIQPAGRC